MGWREFVKKYWRWCLVGAKNRYGHPHQEVLDRLARFKIPVLRTDKDGMILLHSEGKRITVYR